MSVATLAVTRWFKWRLSPRAIGFLLVLFVFGWTVLARHLGLLQFLEFQSYDFFIRHQKLAETTEPIVLIELTEADIHSLDLDYPIYDNKLAELLLRLEADGPAVIGLDIWRDMPVPKSRIYFDELAQVFQQHSNIVAIFTLGGIQPPEPLRLKPDQLAFNDNFPADVEVDGTIPKARRTLLFGDAKSGEPFYSLPMQLAAHYLETKGIVPELDAARPNTIRLGKARLRRFQPNDGAYVGADARGWQTLIDFKCPDRFTRYTVSQALGGQIPAGRLQGKIVLVGMNTQSVVDERVTPTRRDHRGIELQALTTNQLLRQALDGDRALRFWNDWLEDGWVLLWGFAGGAIGSTVRSPWRFAPLAVLCLLSLGGLAWLAFTLGWWIPLVAPAAAFVPASALVTSYVSYQEKRARGQLMQLFSKQVSPDIAQALWEQREEFLAGQRPRSQKLTATVLFTDLEGFSTTSELLEPALLMDWLNEYMEAMATTIMAHHGVIEKYIGDAIMAVFGVPLARTTQDEIREDARHAVLCALAMRAAMEKLNAGWRARGLPACGMRIGIHTGQLIAGSLGSAERQEYTVIGDSVNTASRLESFDKDWVDPTAPDQTCRILVSEATCSLLNKEFQTVRVGTMILKNKNEPVTIYSVTAEINQPYENASTP